MRKKSKEDTFEFDGVVGDISQKEDFVDEPVVNSVEPPKEKKSLIETAKDLAAGKLGLTVEEQKRNIENAGYVYEYARAIANSFSK